ncbi:MAG: histidinol dehydrogenase [Bacillota bacterium]
MKILKYPDSEVDKFLKDRTFKVEEEVNKTVKEIVNQVETRGDEALREYTEKFDEVYLENIAVEEKEIEEAINQVGNNFLKALKKAIDNIKNFHQKQLRENWFSSDNKKMTGQLYNPVPRIGAYVPGGRAAYPSSVLMTVIPALVAGVEEIAVVSPPDKKGKVNPYTLAALKETGITEIYKVGGAQAIAALAAGTESIKPVDKIVGPGNIYVTVAKKQVFGQVDIDMLAGPSEVMILADETARPDFIAADLLSQAEHDPQAIPVLVTTSPKLSNEVKVEIKTQLENLSRIKREIAEKSLEDNGKIIIVKNLETGMDIVNRFAPEHFELIIKEPFAYLDQIKNAGAVFIGEYSSEPLGDYMAGPNHVLPTGGTARFSSPLNTDDFIKKTSIIYYQKEGLQEVEEDIRKIAELESLEAHANAVKIRFSDEDRGSK